MSLNFEHHPFFTFLRQRRISLWRKFYTFNFSFPVMSTSTNKFLLLLAMLLSGAMNLPGQSKSMADTVAVYFDEVRTVTGGHKDLWNYDLYAPVLLVQPDTREAYANAPDTAGILKQVGSIFTGTLPESVNIANTSIEWSGVHWAMVMLPISDDRNDRLNLLTHELFHRAQPHLGFALSNSSNNHLNRKDGRIYLRLELESLRAALSAASPQEVVRHITGALAFRKHRHALYPGADSTENLLELNEGLAEFTGLMTSDRNREQMTAHLVKALNRFLTNPTFVRSFAYQTVPLYGFLLQPIHTGWNREITGTTDLTEYFVRAFDIQLPGDSEELITRQADQYGGPAILAEETAREAEIQTLIAGFKKKFIEQPHVEIALQNGNIAFDPRNIMPLEDGGTVYPNMRVTDNWGILTVTQGALMSRQWNKISLGMPTGIRDDSVVGDGWTLELRGGFVMKKDDASGNYVLTRE
jgi:hypothetical protein